MSAHNPASVQTCLSDMLAICVLQHPQNSIAPVVVKIGVQAWLFRLRCFFRRHVFVSEHLEHRPSWLRACHVELRCATCATLPREAIYLSLRCTRPPIFAVTAATPWACQNTKFTSTNKTQRGS